MTSGLPVARPQSAASVRDLTQTSVTLAESQLLKQAESFHWSRRRKRSFTAGVGANSNAATR